MSELIKNPDSILIALYKSKYGKGCLIKDNKTGMILAIEIGEGENRILLIVQPDTDLDQWAITKFLKEGLVDLHDNTISLTDVGRDYSRNLIETQSG
ncbi:MAG: hypothetical protein ABSE63_05490 [Thermoguttaceae bacterium]